MLPGLCSNKKGNPDYSHGKHIWDSWIFSWEFKRIESFLPDIEGQQFLDT